MKAQLKMSFSHLEHSPLLHAEVQTVALNALTIRAVIIMAVKSTAQSIK